MGLSVGRVIEAKQIAVHIRMERDSTTSPCAKELKDICALVDRYQQPSQSLVGHRQEFRKLLQGRVVETIGGQHVEIRENRWILTDQRAVRIALTPARVRQLGTGILQNNPIFILRIYRSTG